MPSIPQRLDFGKALAGVPSQFIVALNNYWTRLAKVVNMHISFGNPTSGSDNVDGVWASVVTPGVANTDFTITHNLGRVPVGYIPMTKSAACDIYTGSVAATTTQLTLRATAIGVTVPIFIL